ncbi:MAG: DUF6356 family protein [Gammaproteobacteria bacterium]|nr:DUF6356 family protein [Gammaproteobacteria bacterium]MDH5694035.1 DUF6356 family protein [Gammaproteobacteria bacterium]
MNPFLQHPHQQGVSYTAHLFFAARIAIRLLCSTTAFALHAVMPFIDIHRRLDLAATIRFLEEHNKWIEEKKKFGHSDSTTRELPQSNHIG